MSIVNERTRRNEEMRKKWINTAAAALLSIALAGCGSGAAGSSDTGSTSGSSSGAAAQSGSETTESASADSGSKETVELTNVSYDPTRELYAAYNELFQTHYEEAHGQQIEVTQSHGGSEHTLLLGNGNELVCLNVRLAYIIDDLYEYLTTSSEAENLLNAKAYEFLMRRTVNVNLETLLDMDRQALSQDIINNLRAFCDEAAIGLYVKDAFIENIHPPVDIGDVYQSVVSADVKRKTLITNAEAKAIQTILTAEEKGQTMVIDAQATQSTRTSEATQEMAVYKAAFDAYDVDPGGYMFTKLLNTYEKIINGRKVYAFTEGIDPSRFVIGSGGDTLLPVAGWSDIEEMMEEQEAAANQEEETDYKTEGYIDEEFLWFGWSDEDY